MASILLVEDDEKIRSMYNFALSKSGYEVVAVPGAAEAAVVLEGRKFDVILLDMLLTGGMSGLDLLRSSDLLTRSPQTKVVVLSNVESETVVEKAEGLGVAGYLNKADTEPAQLVTYLQDLMANKTVQVDTAPETVLSAEPTMLTAEPVSLSELPSQPEEK